MEIDIQDLAISTFSINKKSGWDTSVDNGIKIIHKPTGTEVTSSSHRSQHQNKAKAMEYLRHKLNNLNNSDVITQQQKEAQDLMGCFFNMLGNLAVNEHEMGALISQKLQCQHKTKQQTYWRIMQAAIEHYGRYSNVDIRNLDSRAWCNEVSEIKKEIPYI